MKTLTTFFLFCAVCLGSKVIAQTKNTIKKPPVTNQTDKNGLSTGFWWINVPAHFGEEAFTDFGHYDHGVKTGMWYKMDGEGNLLSIETYRDNVLNGEVRYFEKGKLTCIGHYRGYRSAKPFDTIIVVDPRNGYELVRTIQSENGTQRHGMWKYYDPQTGKLLKEDEYQVDNLIYHKEYEKAGADSAAYKKYIKNLPHNKHTKTRAPKEFSYLNN